MSGYHGNCFNELDRANLANSVLLLGNHLMYGITFSDICNDRVDNGVSKHKIY